MEETRIVAKKQIIGTRGELFFLYEYGGTDLLAGRTIPDLADGVRDIYKYRDGNCDVSVTFQMEEKIKLCRRGNFTVVKKNIPFTMEEIEELWRLLSY